MIHEAWDGHQQIVDEYRCKLRAAERGFDGEKVALRRIQDLANEARPQALLVRILTIAVALRRLEP